MHWRYLIIATFIMYCGSAQALTFTNDTEHQVRVEVIGEFGLSCFNSYLFPEMTLMFFPRVLECQSTSLRISFQVMEHGASGSCEIIAGSAAHVRFDGSTCVDESLNSDGTGRGARRRC